jgi:uncharacterized membrane protein YidH (DUF202 family)
VTSVPPAVPVAPGPDPGDQPVRTSLAWGRTLLGCVAVGILLARGDWLMLADRWTVVVPLLIAAAAIGLAFARQRALHRTERRHLAVPMSAWSAIALALVVLSFAGLGLAVVVAGPG